MATESTADRSVGLGALFAVVALIGAITMYAGAVGHDQTLAGWGFALAMTAGALVVTVLHVYR